MSGTLNSVELGSRPFYEMENERLRQQLATVTEQRDRAWEALAQYGEHSFNCSACYDSSICDCGFHQAIAEARENGDMRKAPWPDYEGNDVHESDFIAHPSGQRGQVRFIADRDDPSDQWVVTYSEGGIESRLCLQIGDKGQAVVVKNNIG